ncbi:MAG: hypothetical protein M1818_000606 [Claussenomyces sp. TS43310]|nr:MAG: hypothetical protein M1818_000606 [Claussenomyces sp. TS43310]
MSEPKVPLDDKRTPSTDTLAHSRTPEQGYTAETKVSRRRPDRHDVESSQPGHDQDSAAIAITLEPQPNRDTQDPLTWTRAQKTGILSIVCVFYFLFTYQTTAPNPAFTLLQAQFGNASYTQVNWTFAIPSLGLALGPLFTTALADICGRRPVLLAGTALALVASGCCAIRNLGFSGYMAARFFQGFGASPAATVGLGVINDISFEHERGFRIGLWVMAIDLGGLGGGFIGGFLANIDQYWIAYVTTIFYAALLVAELVFLPETLYPRAYVAAAEHQDSFVPAGEGIHDDVVDIKRTKQLGLFRLDGFASFETKRWPENPRDEALAGLSGGCDSVGGTPVVGSFDRSPVALDNRPGCILPM